MVLSSFLDRRLHEHPQTSRAGMARGRAAMTALTSCKRAALVVAALSLLALGVAVLANLGLLPLDDNVRGFAMGLGASGLLPALLLWFTPGDFRDSAPRALMRRYYREFFPPMACYFVVMLMWKRLIAGVDIVWLRVLVALLPAAFIALAIRAIARYVRDSDELQRRIELESVGIAAGLASMACMAAGFLQSAKLIELRADMAMLLVFPAICVFYGVARIFIGLRYL